MPGSDRTFVYKKTPQGELAMHVHMPKDWKPADKRPAIVFFFGGGWTGGTVEQFRKQAEYFASRGMVAARADYRVKSVHGVTPDKCVADAKSAVRYLRANAAALGIDPDRIVASGGSAGGHIAACSGLSEGLEDEDPAVSSRPNAMVLFNPVAKLYGRAPLTAAMAHDPKLAKIISPCAHVKADSPPAIVFYGSEDKFYKVDGREFEKAAKQAGAKMAFSVYQGQNHGFFNHSPYMERTLIEADKFLAALGYLKGPPTITEPKGS
ncbi:MAG: alpha/beta hydrolase [Planctomycetaceae bacterium]|nr:alpha/beta hydrolase [Planctomycetaceae bacterium]